MTLAELRENMEFLQTQISAAEEGETKTKLEASLAATIDAITRMTSKIGSEDVSQTYSKNQKLKALESAFNDVSAFHGTDSAEVERFCGRLSQLHHLLIKNGDASLEPEFVRLSKLKLSNAVFNHIIQSKSDVSTWEKFSDVIRTTYGPKLNATQLLNQIYDLELDQSGKFSLFAQQIHEKIRIGYSALNAQWKKNTNSSTDITGEATALYFGMCIMVQSVKNTNYQLHRDLIKDLDECMDPNQLASKCEWFRDRLGGRVSNAMFNGRRNNRNRSSNRREKNRNRNNRDEPRDGKRDEKKNFNKNVTHDNANDQQGQERDGEEGEKKPKKFGKRGRKNFRHYNKYDEDNKCATEQPATVYNIQEDTPTSADFASSTVFH